jgi:putative endonuclease
VSHPGGNGREDRRSAEARGRLAETIAAHYLRLKGWTILDRRVRTPAGEIDIVMRRPGLVCFVEVKSRKDEAALDLALDRRRLMRVAAAAETLIPRYAGPGDDIRIDAVLIAPGRLPRHLEHVWQG